MRKIRILFYKAKFGDGHWVDNAIATWTGTWNLNWKRIFRKGFFPEPDSHCELWVPGVFHQSLCPDESIMVFEEPASNFQKGMGMDSDHFYGTCWTSTMRGDNNGVVSRPASEVLKNPERWCYYEVEVDSVEDLVEFMDQIVKANQGYSKRDILKFFNPLMLNFFRSNVCMFSNKTWWRSIQRMSASQASTCFKKPNV